MTSPAKLYRDFSTTPHNNNTSPTNKCKGGVKLPFPQKLYSLLSLNPDPSIISWQPHGRAFVVHEPEKFIQKIMPAHFKTQTKMTSFLRQLNLYGFTRILKGRDKGGYYHEMFLRGRKDLTMTIPRLRIKGQRKILNPDYEPNFYKMSWVGVGHEEREDGVKNKAPSNKRNEKKKKKEKQKKPVVSSQQMQIMHDPPIPFSFEMQQTTLPHSNMSVITDASDLDHMEYTFSEITTSIPTTTFKKRARTFSKEEMDEKKMLDPYDDSCGGDIHDACINHTDSEDVDLLWEALVDQRVYPLSWTGQEVDFMHVFDD
ncbi:hypothetical protein CTEN210_00935 [Chaetoceros tenuissimus]|uniref:HSF-type DNA-binding domain-containing protein n=1 Tax=Chaetoceros tenuissimus TaxID=426638 RepID=A0AAD3GZ88_9STRA|nr:hypothetical protein CTEN210_00935 [Chaetoceros tenuissimus]